ncbi:polysaccharide deacetylase family protein [Streptomyces sp. 8N616]|uniref:polysaccharide deacetylase family protein n=1 Tax=Streptomyces sp. 8N616 TaxID=3457414 RepID=UPI003FD0799D
MQLVRQNEKTAQIWRWGTSVRGAAVLILIGVVGGACGQPPDRAPRDRSSPGSEQRHAAALGTVRAPDATYALEGTASGAGRIGGVRAPARDSVPGMAAGAPHRPGEAPGAASGSGPGASAATPGKRPSGQAADAQRAGGGSAGAQGTPGSGAAASRLRSGTTRALDIYSSELVRAEAVRIALARKWGLHRLPLFPPPPPAAKLHLTTPRGLARGSGLPPVIARVPTRDRVVFLTIDDGAHKDRRLIRMLSELGVPASAFLSDYVVRDDYDYFRGLQALDVAINNHTISHRDLRSLSYAGQRKEICRQQETIQREFGIRPRIFRPPYGSYDRDTLRAARSCGITVVPLWSEEAFPGRIEFGDGDRRFRPGDIILTHFRGRGEWGGTMPDVIRRVVRTATAQGFALARLEDYV